MESAVAKPQSSPFQKKSNRKTKYMISSCKLSLLVDLPSEILPIIISKLPVKSILRCKCVSKLLNQVISDPSFSDFYRENSNSMTVLGYNSPSFDLLDFNRQKTSFIHDTLHNPGGIYYNSAFGYCKGMLCMGKVEFNKFHIFVANPLFNDFIQLPFSMALRPRRYIAYGLGYCQFTNRYKVLRIITQCVDVTGNFENRVEIFTIGVDYKWKSVMDVNGPYNKSSLLYGNPNRQLRMVAFNSALHWFVDPLVLPYGEITPKWGGKTRFLCAFDWKDEKAKAIAIPPDCDTYTFLGVIFDKLCICKVNLHNCQLWVMVEYGIVESWTMQFVLNVSSLPPRFALNRYVAVPLTRGLLWLSELGIYVFCDPIQDHGLVFHLPKEFYQLIDYVPSFVSVRDI